MRPAPVACCVEHRSERRLSGVLGQHAEFVWNWKSSGRPHHVLPCDAADLLFVEATGALILSGASWTPRRASTEAVELRGVRLRVGASWKLLGAYASAPVLVSELGAQGRSLMRAIEGKRGDEAERALLAWLEHRAGEISGPDVALERAVMSLWSGAPLRDALLESGLSERTLERRFLKATGGTPKRLQRLVRLCDAVKRRHQGNWADVAALTGYADQAHLIRECREFLGVTPASLRQSECSH